MSEDHETTRPSEKRRLQRRALKQDGRSRRAGMLLDIEVKRKARHEQLESLTAHLDTRVGRLEARVRQLEARVDELGDAGEGAPR